MASTILVTGLLPARAQNIAKLFESLQVNSKAVKVRGDFLELYRNDPNNVLVNYGLAVISSNKALPGYNLFDAFVYIKDALEQYKALSKANENKKISEIIVVLPEPEIKLNYHFNRIDSLLFTEISANPSIYRLQESLYWLRSSNYFKRYLALRDKIEYEKARKLNTIQAYADFITLYPGAGQINEALNMRDSLELENVQKSGVIFVYNDFITRHPLTAEMHKAIKLRDAKAFEITSASREVKDIDYFIYHYPTARQVENAIQLRSEVAYESARRQHTITAYQDFIYNNPGSHYLTRAVFLRDSLVFEEIKKNVTNESFQLFMGSLPFAMTSLQEFLSRYNAMKPREVNENAVKQPYER